MAEQPTDEVRVEVEGRQLTISNLAKVLYPATGTTKGEVLGYYAAIASYLLPHLRDRPVTRVRWPHGTGEASFFEKNLPGGAPSWLGSVTVPSTTSSSGRIRYPFVDDLAGLTYLANLAALELHVPQWRMDRNGDEPVPSAPDRLVVDLDPGAPADLHECAQVALLVRDRLAALGLSCAPVTSGSKGLHLYAALPGDMPADQVREVARLVAEGLQSEHPRLVVAAMTKTKRPGKVFLDWSQNTAAKTTLSPYSLRGRLRPYVAAPRTWAEIEAGAADRDELHQLDLHEVLARTAEHGDLFGSLLAI